MYNEDVFSASPLDNPIENFWLLVSCHRDPARCEAPDPNNHKAIQKFWLLDGTTFPKPLALWFRFGTQKTFQYLMLFRDAALYLFTFSGFSETGNGSLHVVCRIWWPLANRKERSLCRVHAYLQNGILLASRLASLRSAVAGWPERCRMVFRGSYWLDWPMGKGSP